MPFVIWGSGLSKFGIWNLEIKIFLKKFEFLKFEYFYLKTLIWCTESKSLWGLCRSAFVSSEKLVRLVVNCILSSARPVYLNALLFLFFGWKNCGVESCGYVILVNESYVISSAASDREREMRKTEDIPISLTPQSCHFLLHSFFHFV